MGQYCIGIELGMYWACIGIVLRLDWGCIVVLYLDCFGFYCIALEFYCIGVVLILHWYCVGIALNATCIYIVLGMY